MLEWLRHQPPLSAVREARVVAAVSAVGKAAKRAGDAADARRHRLALQGRPSQPPTRQGIGGPACFMLQMSAYAQACVFYSERDENRQVILGKIQNAIVGV